ncbi:lysylphosphatidylglycerol synthetase [Brucella neotomae]|nr:lysylphosphatidylglycerol synthetase [Brucella neotomae]
MVSAAKLPLFLDMGLIALKLGEVARVDLTDFSLEGPRRQPFVMPTARWTRMG